MHNQNATSTEPVISEGFQKAELDAGETMKVGHEVDGTAVEFFQPDKTELELDSSVASPLTSPGGLHVQEPIFEMTGDLPVVGELDADAGVKGDKRSP